MSRFAALMALVVAIGCGPSADKLVDAGPIVPDAPVVPDAAPVIDSPPPPPDAVDAPFVTPDMDATPDADIDADLSPDADIDAPDLDAPIPDARLPDAGRPDAVPVDAGGPLAGGALHCLRAMGGPGADIGVSVGLLSDGGFYATGSFTGTAIFGAGEGAQTPLTADGDATDIFVARFDSSCGLLWARRAGGPGVDLGVSLAVAPDDTLYVTGSFSETATFAPGEHPGQVQLTAVGQSDVFLAHYNRDGSLAWVKGAGGSDIESGSGVAVSGTAVYITGTFNGSATFGFATLVSTGSFGSSAFIARYDTSGNEIWAFQIGDGTSGGASAVRVAALALGGATDGDAYVTGNFRGAARIGTGTTILTSVSAEDGSPSTDMFVIHFNPGGTVVWAHGAGGLGYDAGEDLSVGPDGSVFVTGSFGENNGAAATATFGAGEAHQTVLTAEDGFADVFVARYGPDGTLAWAKRAGGPTHDLGYGIRADSGGAVVVGTYGGPDDGGSIVFGPGEPRQTTLVSRGGYDIFIALYAADGSLDWARSAGGTTSYDQATSVAVSATGSMIVAGRFGGTAFFDTGTLGPSGGISDGFVVVYSP